ncbi:unnamed protein product [Hermetia illucens]|uniref:VWFA domain-containing protein n=1 Tax=Hermetia illucens TaxID=343691 RepID=A0A7R8UDI3_HERIL|nr:unnamed protein product [Hermetia illucens]
MYLHYMNGTNTTRKSKLIAILRNIQIYFCQFNQEVDEAVRAFRLPIEKKLREYVKIESYNKDLSYFALKSNISRMHRHINKFLREFENCLKGKITPVFQYKDNTFKDYDFHNDKGVNLRHEPKHKYYMLDAKNFLVPLKLKNSFKDMLPNIKDSSLLAKRNKLFAASRTIVQESIKNSQYATMVHSLDSLLSNQIETCEIYIISKKKSLSDLYKTLTTIGVNFKSGLLELSLNSEFMNFHIEPFCVKTMFIASKTKKLDQNLIYLSNNLDLYYAKCVFKVKILQRVMLTPNPELDVVNVDRMKGFSIDLFLLVQSQRKLLSAFSQDLLELRRKIADINSLAYCAKYDKFSKDKFCFRKLETDFSSLKYSFCEVQSLIEQYSLLFRCLPQFERNENVALHGFIEEQTLKHYAGDHSKILEKLGKISSSVKEILYEMNTKREIEFLSAQFLEILHKRYGEIIDAIVQVRNDINGPNEEYLPIVKPLNAFLDRSNDREVENYWKWDEQLFQNVGNEIESLIHLVLLSLQKIYKKYIGLKNDLGNPDSIQDDICIMKNHLKEGVYQRFISDIEGLRLPETNRKLSNILFSIKYADDIDMKVVFTNQIASILPILEQFTSLCDFFLLQQMGAHKVSTKMLSIILTVFIELGTKGFCIPPDMISDESKGSEQQDSNPSQGFGLEEGIGENDVSNRLESEDQLDDAKKPQDSDDNENIDNADCKEEKGIEISDDFNANLQDVENHGEENDKNENEINKDEYDKQMEETDCGVDKLDDQIWGSADESEVEDEMDEELEGGARNEVDKQNDNLGQADDQAPTDEKEATDGLDAVNEKALSTTNNRKQNDMELPNESEEMDEEHTNPHHRNLDDPMEPDELELDSMDSGKEERNAESGPDDNEIQNSGSIADDTDSEPEHEFDLAGESHEDLQNSDQEENNEECHSENNPADNENDKIDYNLESTNSANDSSKFEEERNCSENNAYNSREKDDRLRNDKVSDANDVENDTSGDLNDVEKDRNTSGQSKTDVPENGHLSISDSVRVSTDSNQEICDEEVTKRNFDEEKTLGEETGDQVKRLRTVEQLKSTEEESTEQTTKEFEPSHEYQHVNEANETDVSTLDNATEDQSKQIEHKEDEKKSGEEENYNKDQSKVANNEDKDRAKNDLSDRRAEKHKQNLKKSCEKLEKIKQLCETIEKVEMEGEPAATYLILREDSTTAYCKQHVVRDITPQESSSIEENEFRKMYQQDFSSTKTIVPQDEDYETWQSISNKMSSNAHEFCEQLRLILEPTKCTRLKGDYRTGRRLNMRKIIPYIASQFRKDKIWLRRTKPSQRDYKITIAIDDSKSMHHNSSKRLTLEAIALVSEALTVLEIGKLSVISFGESPRVLLYHTEQFDGPKLVCGLGFTQNQSKIADLIDFVRNLTIEEGVNCDTKMFENLLLIISDGRNIYSEGEQRVKHAIKLARLQRIFLVYVIIDNPENKHSILDIRMPHFSTDRKSITMASYLDSFPFPFYVIVRDLQKLPFVLSEAMRQWFELVNSDR